MWASSLTHTLNRIQRCHRIHMQWSMKKAQTKNLSKLQKKNEITHTHHISDWRPIPNLFYFMSATSLSLFGSAIFSRLLAYPPASSLFSLTFFLWLCSDVALTQTHARASNKHGCLALFRSMYRLFCLLILFLLACLFCISLPHTHLFRFLSLIWYRCAQKIHLFGVIKKNCFPIVWLSLTLTLPGPRRTQNTQSWLFWANSIYVWCVYATYILRHCINLWRCQIE